MKAALQCASWKKGSCFHEVAPARDGCRGWSGLYTKYSVPCALDESGRKLREGMIAVLVIPVVLPRDSIAGCLDFARHDTLRAQLIFPAKIGDDFRIQFALGDLNASVKRVSCIVRQNRNLPLRDNFAVIDLVIHMMHRAAGHVFLSRERLLPGFEAGKSWQQRG